MRRSINVIALGVNNECVGCQRVAWQSMTDTYVLRLMRQNFVSAAWAALEAAKAHDLSENKNINLDEVY
jgi:hypothetical protein